jgi:hypothetical protein
VKRVLEDNMRDYFSSKNEGKLPQGIAYKAPSAYTDNVIKQAKSRKNDDVRLEDSLRVLIETCIAQGMPHSLLLSIDDNSVETVDAVVFHDPLDSDVANSNYGIVQSDVTFGLVLPCAGFDKTSFTHGVTPSTLNNLYYDTLL